MKPVIPDAKIRAALTACLAQPKLAAFYNGASPVAQRYILLKFYVMECKDVDARANFEYFRNEVGPLLSPDDIQYLLQHARELDEVKFLQLLRSGASLPNPASVTDAVKPQKKISRTSLILGLATAFVLLGMASLFLIPQGEEAPAQTIVEPNEPVGVRAISWDVSSVQHPVDDRPAAWMTEPVPVGENTTAFPPLQSRAALPVPQEVKEALVPVTPETNLLTVVAEPVPVPQEEAVSLPPKIVVPRFSESQRTEYATNVVEYPRLVAAGYPHEGKVSLPKVKGGTPRAFCGYVFGSRPLPGIVRRSVSKGRPGFFVDYQGLPLHVFAGFDHGRVYVTEKTGVINEVELFSEGSVEGFDDEAFFAHVKACLSACFKVDSVETDNEYFGPTWVYVCGDVEVSVSGDPRGGFRLLAVNKALAD